MKQGTPKGLRLHIALFGRRNVGKSSLLNAIAQQQVAIVSDKPGTTTDPVEKSMELPVIGPVVLIDTAGIDDPGDLGALRVDKTNQAVERTDIALIVVGAGQWGNYEEDLVTRFSEKQTPTIVVFNQNDVAGPNEEMLDRLSQLKIPWVFTVANNNTGIFELRSALLNAAPADKDETIIGDLVAPSDLVVLVTPIDDQAPKGRLILPQVQTIRDLLDHDAYCLVVKDDQLSNALKDLNAPPKLVVTDSQAFAKVSTVVPHDVPMTSFSILFSRFKGDLATMAAGANAIKGLKPGDKVLIAEACGHHPGEEDIGKVKIPALLNKFVGGHLEFFHAQGRDFPSDLSPYKLVIHCGACMWNKKAMLNRLLECHNQNVPITNYGLTIAFALGILDRAIKPFLAGR
jgi:[FeFe] hydrogenase H-cluster maturation GTPase HydF